VLGVNTAYGTVSESTVISYVLSSYAIHRFSSEEHP